MGLLKHGFFSVVNIAVLLNLRLIVDAEPWIQRNQAHGGPTVIHGFSTAWRVGTPNPDIVQGATVFWNSGIH